MRVVLVVALFALGCSRAPGHGLASTSSAECSSCHVEHGAAFASSAHASAARSPVFSAMLPQVEARWGAAARARCESCHVPPHGDDEALGCVSCHAAVGNRGPRDGRMVLDLEAPILGPFEGASAPHRTRTSGLLGASELCATCHEVTGPGLFVEHTGTEHASAALATGAPECAACHMPALDDAPLAAGGAPRARHDHAFVGVDPLWDGTAAQQLAAAEASRALVASALELRFVDGALELENVGAGHSVPTGASFFRDVWVDLDVTHADGLTEHLARVIELGDRPMLGRDPAALPTDADRIEERRLAPFEVRRVALASDVVAARATLRFRAVRADALAALGVDPAAVPELEIVSVAR